MTHLNYAVGMQQMVLLRNVIKDPHRYVVQGSDTTMMTMVASLPGQQ